MLRVVCQLFFIGACCLLPFNIFADNAVSRVTISYGGAQKEPEDIVLAQAFNTLLIRITGNPAIAAQTAVGELLKTPKQFITKYQPLDNQQLLIEFNVAAVQQALDNANIFYWLERPTILVWLAVDDGKNLTLADDSQSIVGMAQAEAAKQGLPVLLPMGDLSEQALAEKELFTKEYPEAIIDASKKYQPNALLIIYVQQQENGWHYQWRLWNTLSDKQYSYVGDFNGSTLEEGMSAVFTAINPPLAKYYVVQSGDPVEIEVTVKDIDFNRYAQVSNIMTAFNGRLVETSGNSLKYSVNVIPARLKARLQLIRLQEVNTNDTKTEASPKKMVFSPQK